ncbi:hypothetical protein CBS101457_000599 [Exobasidium rhododendri]|nr:hypothetical protein CBS101457_000599 [Exobasidium rhododendri]
MAPTEVPALTAYTTTDTLKPDSTRFPPARPHREISGTTASQPRPSSAENHATSSTPSTSSVILGGNAACYDDVRGMLCRQPRWQKEQEEVLLQPYNYLASRPGKGIRSQMIDAFNNWLQVPSEKIQVIHKVIGMLHTSSLLVDDVEDDSTLRRGAPVAHTVYGVPQTINTANYVYFLVFAEVFAMSRGETALKSTGQDRQVEEMIVEEMINLHRGQGMELYWRDNFICPTEAEYIEMVNNKTSGLLRIAIKLMVANSPVLSPLDDRDVLIPLVNLIGLLFQIRDDYMNLRSGDYAENKGFCEDLTEGKFSFPLIHCIRASPPPASNGVAAVGEGKNNSNGHTCQIDHKDLLLIMKSRPKDAKTKQVVVDFMREKTKSFAYTCDVMTRLDRLAFEEATAVEAKLGEGKENTQLRRILLALRRGWH